MKFALLAVVSPINVAFAISSKFQFLPKILNTANNFTSTGQILLPATSVSRCAFFPKSYFSRHLLTRSQ